MNNLSASRPLLALLATSAALLLTSCGDDCAADESYLLTPQQRAWAAPYPLNRVLRFRNAATGYVRTYRVSSIKETIDRVETNSDCMGYKWEKLNVLIVRTDSVLTSDEAVHGLGTGTEAPYYRYYVGMNWGIAGFDLLAKEIDAGKLNLPPATFAGRTYQQVLERTYTITTPKTSPRTVARIYVTKAEGIIRFEERGGSIYDLL